MFKIGPWVIEKPAVLAPMAGVTDLPFRRLCRELGAGMAVSEMLTADSRLWQSRKSRFRLATGDYSPWAIQLLGNDPKVMATAAKLNADRGAQIIDINMGCPAKKVCKKAAGSALLKDERLVRDILQAVVSSVNIPVTLKMRTGWDPEHRNGPSIAKMAEESGIKALAVHGRTRACAFKGAAEYDTIANIVDCVDIPVLTNGDITTAQQARSILDYTGAQAVMIGRGALGNPWLFNEIDSLVTNGSYNNAPTTADIRAVVTKHLLSLHEFYGEDMGSKIARKHIGWYLEKHRQLNKFTDGKNSIKKIFNRIETAKEQQAYLQSFFDQLETNKEEKAA